MDFRKGISEACCARQHAVGRIIGAARLRRLRRCGLLQPISSANGRTYTVLAGHVNSQTTKFYDRRGQKVLLEDMEAHQILMVSFKRHVTGAEPL